MSGEWQVAGSRYRNTRLAYTGTVTADSARDATPVTDFDTAFGSDANIIPARRVIIRNMNAAGGNSVTVRFKTMTLRGGEQFAGGKITIPAVDSIDTFYTLKNIVDVVVAAVNNDVIEIYQQTMDATETNS